MRAGIGALCCGLSSRLAHRLGNGCAAVAAKFNSQQFSGGECWLGTKSPWPHARQQPPGYARSAGSLAQSLPREIRRRRRMDPEHRGRRPADLNWSLSPAAVGGRYLPSVELPGDGVEARVTGGLNLSNDRQNVGRELRRLRLTGRAHAFHGAGGQAYLAAFRAPWRSL
jgi:hypothetical protein